MNPYLATAIAMCLIVLLSLAGTAYLAAKHYLQDDRAPYVYRTQDYGRTWTRIVGGIRADDYVHVVREDPTRAGLLYVGTEHGVYVSWDDGATVKIVE